MTGSLRVHRDAPPRRPHDHVDIEFDGGIVLRYHDPRRFGTILWSAQGDEHGMITGEPTTVLQIEAIVEVVGIATLGVLQDGLELVERLGEARLGGGRALVFVPQADDLVA